jgi:hypothetical protein
MTTALAQRPRRRLPPSITVTPLATSMVVLLLAGAVVLKLRPGDAAAIVAWTSTNVQNLTTHPVASLLASAFVVPEGLLPELLLVALGFTILERRIGTLRTAAVALTGHVLATLLTEYGAYLLTDSATDRADVGVSYAMFAVLSTAALHLTGRTRLLALTAIAAAVLIPVALDPEMTTTGHLLAVLIGPAVAHATRQVRRRVLRMRPVDQATGTLTRSGWPRIRVRTSMVFCSWWTSAKCGGVMSSTRRCPPGRRAAMVTSRPFHLPPWASAKMRSKAPSRVVTWTASPTMGRR